MSDQQAILSSAQVAELLHCSVQTVELRARKGDLPGLQFGNGWVFPVGALHQRLNELALEAARERAKPKTPAPTATLRAVPTKRRTLPILPDIG
jgi:hypothetical protein